MVGRPIIMLGVELAYKRNVAFVKRSGFRAVVVQTRQGNAQHERAHMSNRVVQVLIALFLALMCCGYTMMFLPRAMEQSRRISATQQAHTARGKSETSNSIDWSAIRAAVAKYDQSMRTTRERDPFVPFDVSLPKGYLTVMRPAKQKSQQDGRQVIGTLRIPSIDLDEPINYMNEDGQISGITHYAYSPLPSTITGINPVILGHNGMNNDFGFSNLPNVKVGDHFYLDVLGQTLTYRVDKISEVRPDNFKGVQGVKDKNYVTLLTCVPRYINDHRLLVRGELESVNDINPASIGEATTQGLPSQTPSWLPYVLWFLPLPVLIASIWRIALHMLEKPVPQHAKVAGRRHRHDSAR